MKSLERLTGADLKEMRRAFGIRQVEVATVCDVSWPTVQRAEGRPRDRISELFALKLGTQLMSAESVGLQLGLTERALDQASWEGLNVWNGVQGAIYWRPNVNTWLGGIIRRTPVSSRDLALQVLAAIKISQADGLLLCQECADNKAKRPRLAHNRCGRCQKAICAVETCGSRVTISSEWIVDKPIHLCASCIENDPKVCKWESSFMSFRELDRPYL